jgi:LPS export ABC transporter protein LptC
VAGGPDRTRQLNGILLFLGILVLASVIVMFWLHKGQSDREKQGATAARNDPTISLLGVHHTDIRRGSKEGPPGASSAAYRKEGFLDAESAEYRLEEKRAYLKKLEATFFDSVGKKVLLSADSGVYYEDSNDLEVSGNVVLKNNQYVMRTDRLLYTESKQLFSTMSKGEILAHSIRKVADGMTYSLNTRIIVLEGNVEGEIGNGIGL